LVDYHPERERESSANRLFRLPAVPISHETLHSQSNTYVKKSLIACISGIGELPLRSIRRNYFINLFVEQDSEIRDDKPAKSKEVTDE